MPSALSLGNTYRQQGKGLFGQAAALERNREAANQKLAMQERQQKGQLIGQGAGMGAMAGSQIGAVGGPAGMAIGAGVGLLASEVF